MKTVVALLLLFLLPFSATADWGRVSAPLAGPAEVIGFYNAGCIAGAATLPLAGVGYQVLRPARNRYYGHPNLIAFVERLGRQTAATGGALLIGDLSQPRGGPMPSGHRSHQIGLDVDVWFFQEPSARPFTAAELATRELPSMVSIPAGDFVAEWSSRQREALQAAASDPAVERIFVNPIIKRSLCRSERDRRWLAKLRPWWGHDAHFHVRLRCPPDSPNCRPQDPFPAGDGCTADLDQWVWDLQHPKPPKKITKPTPPPALPARCQAVLNGAYR